MTGVDAFAHYAQTLRSKFKSGIATEHSYRPAVEQLLTDILEVFPPGPQRDVWLAWLEQLTAECAGQGLTLH
jgi:plasmid stabilization system protein ParE